jgi:hypothetical protein
MNYHKILQELVEEREDLDQAIRAIEPLARRRQKRRGPGRPPLLFNFKSGGLARRGPGRPPGSTNKVKRGPGRPPKAETQS